MLSGVQAHLYSQTCGPHGLSSLLSIPLKGVCDAQQPHLQARRSAQWFVGVQQVHTLMQCWPNRRSHRYDNCPSMEVHDEQEQRQRACLHRRQPQGKGACVVLQQDAEEALYGPKNGAVQHDGPPLLLVCIRILLHAGLAAGHHDCGRGSVTTAEALAAELVKAGKLQQG